MANPSQFPLKPFANQADEGSVMVVDHLDQEIAAFEAARVELEKNHLGKWVVFRGSDFLGAFDTFESAAEFAVHKYGAGPYLIRQVGAADVVLPASVVFNIR
jgi:poly-D-alanine transfer protein DltD